MTTPASMSELSTTAASNNPPGSDAPSTLDDQIRALAAIVRQNVTKGTDIASASSITIPASGNYFVVTGTTGITGISDTNSWYGREVVLKFSGALTITHSSSLILPGATDIITGAGDVLKFVSESSGVWRMVGGVKADGTAWVSTAPDPVPSGTVTWFAANTAPTGYLKANGAAVSRTTYADLFTAIGTTFGVGDGSTTFNIPDLRGEFIRGWDDSRGVDSGRTFGSAQSDAVVDHKHKMGTIAAAAGADAARGPANYGTGTAQLSSGAFDTGGSSTIGDTETRPRNVALLACIKY